MLNLVEKENLQVHNLEELNEKLTISVLNLMDKIATTDKDGVYAREWGAVNYYLQIVNNLVNNLIAEEVALATPKTIETEGLVTSIATLDRIATSEEFFNDPMMDHDDE